ncbi:hypothetical protein DFJ63DRAFT_311203 [Scheffersomyces coipomensis]|uniref:uncharacterized protein n=1 Tax=Scheffersomyces coipomensis TaxID=1788519 RepID=UPI00315CB95A
MGEGYEELTTCLGDSLSDYNVFFVNNSPVTVRPREFRDFDASLDLIVIECINYLNLTAIVRTEGNIPLYSDDDDDDDDDDVYTFDYLNDPYILPFNCQSF